MGSKLPDASSTPSLLPDLKAGARLGAEQANSLVHCHELTRLISACRSLTCLLRLQECLPLHGSVGPHSSLTPSPESELRLRLGAMRTNLFQCFPPIGASQIQGTSVHEARQNFPGTFSLVNQGHRAGNVFLTHIKSNVEHLGHPGTNCDAKVCRFRQERVCNIAMGNVDSFGLACGSRSVNSVGAVL